MMTRALGALFVALALAGCAAPRAPAALITPQMGGERPANTEAAIRAYFEEVMKDPSSVQFRRWAGPTPMDIPHGGRVFRRPIWGWVVCLEANAKNSFGAYTGFKRYAAAFQIGQLAAVVAEDSEWPAQREEIADICAKVQAGAGQS